MKKSAAIIVNCKLDNDSLYQIVDEEFINADMKKVCEGKYIGTEDTYNSSFFAIRSLFKNSEFVKAIKSFTRDCGDGDEDLMEYYKYLIKNNRI